MAWAQAESLQSEQFECQTNLAAVQGRDDGN